MATHPHGETVPHSDRHSGVQNLMRWLTVNPKLPREQSFLAYQCQELAQFMLDNIPDDNPELTEGLRKLLEAKDCFVRASMSMS